MTKTRIKTLVALVAVAAVSCLTGCGYTTRSMIAGKYRTVYITPFKNKIDITRETNNGTNYRIYRPALETDVTSAVVQKFLIDGNLKPVKEHDSADLVLEGDLTDFHKDALRYDRNDNVQEYRVNVGVRLKITDQAKGQVLWEEPSFTGYASYFVSGAQANSEAAAISDAITDLSRRVVERTVDQW